MNNFTFWARWMFGIAVLIVFFGLFMALFNGTKIFDLFNDQINPVFWDRKDISGPAEDFQQWVYGLTGATMAGWGLMFAYLARFPFCRKERWAWNAVAFSIALWYVVDTAISIRFEVYFNAFFNTVLLVLLAVPLVLTRKEFGISR